MEWIGLVALALVLCYASYPGRVKRLEATIKKVERQAFFLPVFPLSCFCLADTSHRRNTQHFECRL